MNHHFSTILGALVAILVGTRVMGLIAKRLGQPAVLGELIAGVLLGKSVLNLVDPADPVIGFLAELGVVILLFAIGLETNLRKLIKVGSSSLAVGATGVILPFVMGYFVARGLGLGMVSAIVCGAALTATSVGISARVLSDLGWLSKPEGQIVLGAAVIDDVIGLVILSIVASLVAGAAITAGSVSLTVAIAVGFLAVVVVVGSRVIPPFFKYLDGGRLHDYAGPIAITFALLVAWLAALSGAAVIIGAFAAGLVLHDAVQREKIEDVTTSLGHFFVPVFFATVGAGVDLSSLADGSAVKIAGGLFIVGVLGKLAAGYAPFWFTGSKSLIGIAMVPRGEVGLIFAQMGAASGALNTQLFSAVTLTVMATTFIVPPLLGRYRVPDEDGTRENLPGEGGVDDLVT
jgi:Kef-type K+ transport system membrane component KefB